MIHGGLLIVDGDSPTMENLKHLGASLAEVDVGDRMSRGKEGILCLDCTSSCQCKAGESYGCMVISEAMMLVPRPRNR